MACRADSTYPTGHGERIFSGLVQAEAADTNREELGKNVATPKDYGLNPRPR